jgi:hypothetical protein
MLFGFPVDYWSNDCIQSAIASFGRVLLSENDRRKLARLLVKARVTDLNDVPHFIVLTEADGLQSHSWTIQCEILKQQILPELPADEEEVADLGEHGQPPLFDFFLLDEVMEEPQAQQQEIGIDLNLAPQPETEEEGENDQAFLIDLNIPDVIDHMQVDQIFGQAGQEVNQAP